MALNLAIDVVKASHITSTYPGVLIENAYASIKKICAEEGISIQ